MKKIKLKEGMILRRLVGLSLYWSNRSGYTSKKWTAGKAYRVHKDKEVNIYIADDMGYCAFITEVEDGRLWQVFPPFNKLDKKIQREFIFNSFLRPEYEDDSQIKIAEELYEFSIGSSKYFPKKMFAVEHSIEEINE